MSKKKQKFHGIHITPKAGTHYEVRHDPVQEPAEGNKESSIPMQMGEDEKHEKLFAHGDREKLHQHIDDLMNAHEGADSGNQPDADDMPMGKDHPLKNLRKKW